MPGSSLPAATASSGPALSAAPADTRVVRKPWNILEVLNFYDAVKLVRVYHSLSNTWEDASNEFLDETTSYLHIKRVSGWDHELPALVKKKKREMINNPSEDYAFQGLTNGPDGVLRSQCFEEEIIWPLKRILI